MKVIFKKGKLDPFNPSTMIIYPYGIYIPFFSEASAGFYRKNRKGIKDPQIFISRQKYDFYTILIILHELFHFFIDEFFGDKLEIDNIFDKFHNRFINPILARVLLILLKIETKQRRNNEPDSQNPRQDKRRDRDC